MRVLGRATLAMGVVLGGLAIGGVDVQAAPVLDSSKLGTPSVMMEPSGHGLTGLLPSADGDVPYEQVFALIFFSSPETLVYFDTVDQTQQGIRPEILTVPEPASVALLSIGLFGVVWFRRKASAIA